MENNKVKIGARILSDASLEKLLPTNKKITEQIEVIREVARVHNKAKTNEKKDGQLDREFERHFNNIFSILVGRGSGKTSVLLTMKYKITENNSDKDIILPLIVPEIMGQTSDVLGWILGSIGDAIDEIEKNFYDKSIYLKEKEFKGYFESCRKKQDNPLREKYNELLKQYGYTKPDYRTILIKQFVGLNEYIENARNMMDSDQKLVVKFEELLEEIFKIKKKDNESKHGMDNQPLLFVFFDDVDLSTDRCAEVLSVALRYLSNSNVVVFVAGNYMTFSEVLTIDALKKDGILYDDMMKSSFFTGEFDSNKTALEIRTELTQDYLKKVMPPAFRYYIPLIDDKAKAEFVYSTEEDTSKKGDNYSQNKENYENFCELISMNFIPKGENNFLMHKDSVIYSYFKIFDNTQRGMMNIYYFLHSMFKESQVNSGNYKEKEFCLQLDRFLNTIMQSSSILSKYENNIRKIISIKESCEATYIDYEYLKYLLESRTINESSHYNIAKKIEEDNQVFVEEMLTICILACFVENIIVLQEKRFQSKSKRTLHGEDMFIMILEKINSKFAICPKLNDFSENLYLYTLLSNSITNRNMSKIEDTGKKNYFLSMYFRKLIDLDEIENRNKYLCLFEKAFKQDKKWVEDKIDIILNHGKEEILIIKESFERNYKEIINMIPYEAVVKGIKNSALEEFNLVKNTENIKKYLENQLNEKFIEGKISNNEIIELKNKFEDLYLEFHQHLRLNKDIEYKEKIIKDFKEQNNDEYLNNVIRCNLPMIEEAREQTLERIEELKVEIARPRRKKMWENALKRGQIQYVSFEGNKMGGNDKKDNLCTFTVNNVEIIKKYKLFLDTLKIYGSLVKVKELTPTITSFTKVYFKEVEELKILEEYLIDEIEAIIELYNKILKYGETKTELDALLVKRGNMDIGVKEENIKKSDTYMNHKTELEIDKWENSKEFYNYAIKKLSVIIYKNEKKNIIGEKLDIAEVKILPLIEEFYQGKINEMRILFDSFKNKVVKKSDVFQSLYYILQQTIDSDINENISAILDNNLVTVDLKILEDIIEKLIIENEEIAEIKERKSRQPLQVVRYNVIEIMKNIKIIQSVPRVFISEDIYEKLQLEIAQEKISDIFINYIRVDGLLEIIRREDDFYEEFKEIRMELFKTKDNGFKSFLNIKTRGQEQVQLYV
ncbi:hypothetical protein [Clostridium estertheticum]|uniref:hypothetical protein n=1 Tax=Clostridium estertheticum TaxID=238834 RepID=UPI00124CCC69|nr:hypothetical protein [Clostridium estertheticum]MBZ9613958.1 hypothetical protein [Clostridium estertheticum subsp. laramiense]WAG73916.1 hypothetical protein LL032_00180 [Clostridium estertheticum]